MRRLITVLSALLVLSGAAHARGTVERAMAADLTGAGRDAIVFRLPDGAGAGVFLPDADGRYVLKILGGLGPDVRSLTLGDADHDGAADLLVTRADGELVFWKGIAGGDFSADLVDTATLLHGVHDLHAAHRAASAVALPLKGAERDRIVAALSQDALRTDGVEGVEEASLTSNGALEIVNGAARTVIGLPEGFAPRLIASGRFDSSGERSFAVIGEGSRPRLALVTSTSGGVTSSGATLDWVVSEVQMPKMIFNVNVASAGFSFTPSTVTIAPGDTVHWIWVGSGHTVTSGTDCVADNQFCSPSNTLCASAPTSNAGAFYDRVFPAAGTFDYFCRPHCSFMTGVVNVQAPPSTPGTVPDRAPGVPLRVNELAGDVMLRLTWGASCSAGVTAYGIYEGTIPVPGAYNHTMKACPAGTATTADITPTAGNHYYLVVPRTASAEGSYGKNSANAEIPVGAATCVLGQNLAACP